MQKFYALKGSTPTTGGPALFGPGVWPSATTPLDNNLAPLATTPSVAGPYLFDGPCRALKFPGILRVEVPAIGGFTMSNAAGVTNNAEITLDDGNTSVVFSLHKSGGTTPATEVVDLTTAVTAADVAAAFKAAVDTWTATQTAPDGFQVSLDGAGGVRLVQAKTLKSATPLRSWLGFTNGNAGNQTITLGVGTGVTNVTDMRGGRNRKAGIPAFMSNHQRLLPIGGFVPPMKPPIR